MNPDNNTVGSIRPTREMIMATCWVFETVEIVMPIDNAKKINNRHNPKSKNTFPLTGT
ncbi:hypothetical protein ES705_42757 [subsurface metagenome]